MANPAGADGPGSTGDHAIVRLASEYAAVEIARDDAGNGGRLRVTDLRSGKSNWFDPLELEALVWAAHAELAQFMDPGRRWSDDND